MNRTLNSVVIAGLVFSLANPVLAQGTVTESGTYASPQGSDSQAASSQGTANSNVVSGESAIGDFANGESQLAQVLKNNLMMPVINAATEPEASAPAAKKEERKPSKLVSKLEREIKRYRLSVTIGKDGEIVDGMPDGLGLDTYYQAIVEPNFQEGEQVRRDVYVIGLGVGKKDIAGSHVSAAIETYIRITFSRVFSGSNAKSKAIWTMPYFPTKLPFDLEKKLDPQGKWTNKLPLNANEIKTKLSDRDSVRVEILGNIGGGIGRDHVDGNLHTGIGLNLVKEAIFMVDAYKHSSNVARLRLMGLQNKGRLSLTPSIRLIPDIKIAKSQLSAGIVIDWFTTFNPLRPREDFPVNSMMVDYLYRFASPTPVATAPPGSAEEAVDELMGNVRSFKFLPLFSLLQNEDQLAPSLLKYAEKSEALAKADQNKPILAKLADAKNATKGQSQVEQARVRHVFKGQIRSAMTGVNLDAKALKLVKGFDHFTAARTFVAQEESDGSKKYYLLESSSRSYGGSAVAGRYNRRTVKELDALVTSDEKAQIGDLLDVVATTEIRDNEMDSHEMGRLRTSLLGDGRGLSGAIPSDLQTPEVRDFIPTQSQDGAYFRMKASYGLKAWGWLSEIQKPLLHQKLIEFIENHPQRQFMNLPCDQPQANINLSEYTDGIATLLKKAVQPDTSNGNSEISRKIRDERMMAFRTLMGNLVFQGHILGEFLPQFFDPVAKAEMKTWLPLDKVGPTAKESMGIELQFTSEQTKLKSLPPVGDSKVSDIYRTIAFMRTIINDRSYDLHLDTVINADKNEALVSPQYKRFKAESEADQPVKIGAVTTK